MSIAINQRVFPHTITKDVSMSTGEGESSVEPQPTPSCIMADELDRARLTTHHIHVIGERFHLVGTDVYEADETDDLLDQASHTLRVQEALLKAAIAKHPDLLDGVRAKHPELTTKGK